MSNRCSFCGADETARNPLVDGIFNNAKTCKSCSESSLEEFEEILETKQLQSNTFLKPHEIKTELDKFIVGQEEAKMILSVAVYNHYKRINSKSKIDIQKSNIMLVGPTGSGKTYLIQMLAKILNVPLVIVDATSFTESGYVGEDVESILEKLLQKANGDMKKAESGIVYIDEIDKIANQRSENKKISRDISGEGVQQALLKMIEDTEFQVPLPGSHIGKHKGTIQTKNILFIAGGAFVGIDEILKERINPQNTSKIGFLLPSKEDTNVDEENEITQQDIIEYGFIPEFVGRMPVVTTLNPLTKEDLRNIFTKTKNSVIKQYQALLRDDGIKLKFDNDAIEYIVEEAWNKKVGARGLKGVIEKRMYKIMYDLAEQENVETFTITKEILLKK